MSAKLEDLAGYPAKADPQHSAGIGSDGHAHGAAAHDSDGPVSSDRESSDRGASATASPDPGTSSRHNVAVPFNARNERGSIFSSGIWVQNPALVMLLGLCPLLAVSTTLVNGVVLGVATAATLCVSNMSISALRHWIPNELRLPIFVSIVATVVTIVDLVLMSTTFSLHRQLGLFIPLIVTNCTVLARAEAFASRQPIALSAADGLGMGLGFAGALIGLGALREILGFATLGRDAHLLLGGLPGSWQLDFVAGAESGMLIAILPPGAFFGLALLAALRQAWQQRRRDI